MALIDIFLVFVCVYVVSMMAMFVWMIFSVHGIIGNVLQGIEVVVNDFVEYDKKVKHLH